MNDQNKREAWEWERPSYRAFAKSLFAEGKELLSSRPRLTWSVLIGTILLIYIYRYLWHPYLLTFSIFSGALVAAGLLALAGWIGVSMVTSEKVAWFLKPVGAICGILLMVFLASYGKDTHTYLAQYWRYQTLDIIDIERLPTTEHERIWALHGIHSFMRQRMNETEAPSKPQLVRIGKEFDWTMGIEPSSPWLRYFDPIDEVVSLDSTITSFDLQRGKNVHFETGEKLLFSRNIYTCVQRAFWFWQSFRHEPSESTLYLKNDQDKWVQVVPIIRWRGYAAPRPEFGGVFVVEQSGPHSWYRRWFWESPKRVFLGCGTWIGPNEVHKHKYLVGQNLVPYEVSRFMAASIRFQGGLFAPQKWRKEGDIRIPDLAEDVNQQPFTMYFNVHAKGKVHSKLYHYFALEPSDKDKQALAVSFWVPADGVGPQFRYKHLGRSESLLGASAIAGRVRSTKRAYDWSKNEPVEHRPYLREVVDEKGNVTVPFRWLTTVVTIDKQHTRREDDPPVFVTGLPEIAITDARTEDVVWVDRQRPDNWPKQLLEALTRKGTE